jgi:hypothetical protein
MARKIKALVLRNICTESEGIVRKGDMAMLSGAEMAKYVSIGAVERPELSAEEFEVVADLQDEIEIDTNIEGGDA